MEDVVIVGAARTADRQIRRQPGQDSRPPISARSSSSATAGARGLEPEQVSEVIMGQVLTAGVGQNPARQAAIKAGSRHGAGDDHQQGLRLGPQGRDARRAGDRRGDAEIVIAGGQENMSLSPHVLNGSRDGFRMGDAKMIDTMIVDGLWDVYNQYHMGVTAENVAKEYAVTREEQDEFAVASQNKAEAAQKAGKFKDEIVPVEIPSQKGDPIAFRRPTNISATARRSRR